MMSDISSVLALFLAMVLAGAAIHKLVATERLAAAAARLTRMPLVLGKPISFSAAAIEAGAALALLAPQARWVGAGLAVGLWLIYGLALWSAWRREERSLDCGCSFGSRNTGISAFSIARPLGLAALAALLCQLPAGPVTIESVFAALTFFSLYLAAGELAALPPLRRKHAL